MKKILVLVIIIGIVIFASWVGVRYSQNKQGFAPTKISSSLIPELHQEKVVTSDQAISLVQKKYPEYKGYPSDNLPPKRIETIVMGGDWLVGMYVEGSGVKGILKANCFLVTKNGIVTETGLFQGEGPAKSINLVTCVPKE